EHLGYAGRRVLVSRKWSNKTLADHKADRLAWVLEQLGVDPDAPDIEKVGGVVPLVNGSFAWELARPTDPDVPPREHRLLRAVGETLKGRARLDAARSPNLSATDGSAACPRRSTCPDSAPPNGSGPWPMPPPSSASRRRRSTSGAIRRPAHPPTGWAGTCATSPTRSTPGSRPSHDDQEGRQSWLGPG